MNYSVIIISDGPYTKVLHRSKTRDTAFIHYHRFKEKNNVLYPRKYVNSNGIKPVKYMIAVTKIKEDIDTPRTLRDDYGKVYTEKLLGDWIILEADEYLIEETFWIYGFKPIGNERPNISEIVKRLMQGAYAKNMVKQIIVVHNKLLIYNEDQFDMILCKNLVDAQRLHHTLAKIAKKQKLKSLLFMGTAGKVMISDMYDLIHEKTQWAYTKIWRTSTRP